MSFCFHSTLYFFMCFLLCYRFLIFIEYLFIEPFIENVILNWHVHAQHFAWNVKFLFYDIMERSCLSRFYPVQDTKIHLRVVRYSRNGIALKWSRKVQIMFPGAQGSAELSQETSQRRFLLLLGFWVKCHLEFAT